MSALSVIKQVVTAVENSTLTCPWVKFSFEFVLLLLFQVQAPAFLQPSSVNGPLGL